MDGFTFFLKLIEVLAWPLVGITALLLLRKELRALISKAQKVKAGSVEFEFDREVRELRAEVENKDTSTAPRIPKDIEGQEELKSLAESKPPDAVLEAFSLVERSLANAGGAVIRSRQIRVANVPKEPYLIGFRMVQVLLNQKLLTQQDASLYLKLRSLLPLSVGTNDDRQLSTRGADAFIELSLRLKMKFDRIAKENDG